MNTRKLLGKLLADESGQAAVEYVVLLVVLTTIIMALGRSLRDRMSRLVSGPINRQIQGMFSSGRVHQFRFNPNR